MRNHKFVPDDIHDPAWCQVCGDVEENHPRYEDVEVKREEEDDTTISTAIGIAAGTFPVLGGDDTSVVSTPDPPTFEGGGGAFGGGGASLDYGGGDSSSDS